MTEKDEEFDNLKSYVNAMGDLLMQRTERIKAEKAAMAFGRWISVADKAPELDKWVIGYGKICWEEAFSVRPVRRRELRYPTSRIAWECEETSNEGDNIEIDEVTHWMPLPEPPESTPYPRTHSTALGALAQTPRPLKK